MGFNSAFKGLTSDSVIKQKNGILNILAKTSKLA
jgi:hypothetical protein